MPLYNLKCTNEKCNFEFEKEIKLDDLDKKIKCPKCKKKAEIIISNPQHYKHLSWSKWRAK